MFNKFSIYLLPKCDNPLQLDKYDRRDRTSYNKYLWENSSDKLAKIKVVKFKIIYNLIQQICRYLFFFVFVNTICLSTTVQYVF
jgi:hypothetical protein